MLLKKPLNAHGFTIVELLVVMAVLSIIAAITLIALNPASQFARSRNIKRGASIESIANGIQQYTSDTRGILPPGITATATSISSTGVDLCDLLIPDYIAALPQDPDSSNGANIRLSECGDYDTGFTIRSLEQGHFIVEAPSAEEGATISETR